MHMSASTDAKIKPIRPADFLACSSAAAGSGKRFGPSALRSLPFSGEYGRGQTLAAQTVPEPKRVYGNPFSFTPSWLRRQEAHDFAAFGYPPRNVRPSASITSIDFCLGQFPRPCR